MKKFKFRYESVLKMRMDQEDRIKNELAQVITIRQNKIDALEKLIQSAQLYDYHVQTVLESGDSSNERAGFSQNKRYYRDKKSALRDEIEKLDQKIKQIQLKLVDAMKERKVMEKLKENAFKEFVEAINEADEKLIEEVVNYSNNKRNGE